MVLQASYLSTVVHVVQELSHLLVAILLDVLEQDVIIFCTFILLRTLTSSALICLLSTTPPLLHFAIS